MSTQKALSSVAALLGGPASAIILVIALEPRGWHGVAWFSLVPLLSSLEHHRESARLRFADGFGFGLFLAAGSLSWFAGTALPAGEEPGGIAGLAAAGICLLRWCALAIFPAVVALAVGPLFRATRIAAPLFGIPVLWAGLETLRGSFAPVRSEWFSGWLYLGHALSPDSPEAQTASLAGVHGLSLAVAFTGTALSLVPREIRASRQAMLALVALAVPLSMRAFGLVSLLEAAPQKTFIAGVASHGGALEDRAKLTLKLHPEHPEIVVWPPIEPDGMGLEEGSVTRVRREVVDLARALDSTLIAGAEPVMDGGERVAGTLVVSRSGHPSFHLGRVPARDLEVHAREAGPAGVFNGPRGRIGLVPGFDLDEPTLSREVVQRGARILVASASTHPEWGARGEAQHARLQRFRAVENRRWLLRSAPSFAFIADPYGRPVLEFQGVEASGTERVEMVEAKCFYTRLGWWIEPASLLGATWTLAWALMRSVTKQRGRVGSAGELDHYLQ